MSVGQGRFGEGEGVFWLGEAHEKALNGGENMVSRKAVETPGQGESGEREAWWRGWGQARGKPCQSQFSHHLKRKGQVDMTRCSFWKRKKKKPSWMEHRKPECMWSSW